MKNYRNNTQPLVVGCVLAALLVLSGCSTTTPAPVVSRDGQQATAAAKNMYTVKQGDTIRSIARDFGMDYRELIAMNNIESPDRIAPGKVLKVKAPASASAANSTNATNAAGVTTAPITTDVVVAKPLDGGDTAVEQRPLSSNTDKLKQEPKAGKVPYSDQALAQAQNPTPAKPAEAAVAVAGAEAKPETKPEVKPAEPAAGGEDVAWIWPANGKTIGTFSEGGNKGVDIAGKAGDPVVAAGGGKVVYSGSGLRGYGKLVIIKHNNTFLSAYAHNQAIMVGEGSTVTKGQKIAEMGNTETDQVKLHFEVRRQGKPVDPLKYLPPR